ncbi:MAG: acylhydrolase [Bacteroidales bacterium]|nr:acylhydrolase [Bacteroidales bacterium]
MKKLFAAALFAALSLAAAAQNTWSADDFAHKYRYSEANASVTKKPVAVLYGDSITDGWATADPDFFTKHNFAGRGISGEVTSQMVLRFRKDVVALRPRYVVILAGINDIAHNNGYCSIDETIGNIMSMCEIARANGIIPVLCTTTPANRIPWRKDITAVNEKVRQLNDMIRYLAKARNIKLVEYYNNMATEDGDFPAGWANDGIHPTLEGYKAMEEILLKKL